MDYVGWLRTTGKTMNHKEFGQIVGKSKDKSVDTGITDRRNRSSPRATISFEELCPQWSLALATGVSLSPSLDIKEGKKCIVGEAHGFRNSAYLCSKCWEYSQSFVSSVYGNELSGYFITDHELFESIKDAFLQHFNQRHVNCKYKLSTIIDNVWRLIQSLVRVTAITDAPNRYEVLS
ncbi:MAG: hypothetical protein WBY22_00435 [Nitrososphaeraceae archaeon]